MNLRDATRSHARRLTSFAAIGVINTALDISAFVCLYELADFGVISANIVAFLLAVTCSYVLNRLITFSDRTLIRGTMGTFVRFLGVAIVAMTLSTVIVYAISMVMYPLIGKLVATAVSTLVNYVGANRLVFDGYKGARSDTDQRS